MKHIKLLLLLILWGSVYLVANNGDSEPNLTEFSQPTYHPQGIIIIIDRQNVDYEEAQSEKFDKIGTLTSEVLYALLNNEKTPILVSKSLLTAFIRWYLWQSDKNLKTKVFNLKKSLIIKEYEDFYLLVKNDWEQQGNIGFRLAHLKDSTWGNAATFNPPKQINNTPIKDILENIFVNKNEFKQDTSPIIPYWMVYVSGHGQADVVAGLSLNEFKQFTNFLKNQINTKILIYGSCYAGGLNKLKAFQDIYREGLLKEQALLYQESFPFPIIMLSITDSPIFTNIAFPFAYPIAPFNYDFLFKQLAQSSNNIPDYYAIIKESNFLTSPEKDPTGKLDIILNNFPQIRLPNTEWFSVAALNDIKTHKDYIVISKVEAQTRRKALIVPNNIASVFIYSPTIPFNITVEHSNNERIARFIPMDFIKQIHMAELNLPNLDFKNVCRLFMPLSQDLNLRYFIDSLTFNHNNKTVVLKNCFFVSYLSSNNHDFKFKLYGRDSKNSKIMLYEAQIAQPFVDEDFTSSTIALKVFEPHAYQGKIPGLPKELIFNPIGKKIEESLKKKLAIKESKS